ncbi:MAG: class I mannose-6-phosphate isomerase [Myxococcales bacterium]|nr:class I mannose-6-phosphate isomerase [Myxococcales bacterium]
MTPLRLEPDNFTPATRTPWGGRRIVDVVKAGLALAPEKAAFPVVGESWELSVDPAFPSRVAGTGVLLTDALPEARATRMLVKLLDAADDLSVQVHPPDDYAGLGPGESGKPEMWYVLHADEGAGIYLGLAEGVSREALTAALAAGDDLRPMLSFVPVRPGDAYEIGPGTVHAVGRGVTLVEPQLVAPGTSGVTYRFWDWNRRYDAAGRRDPGGEPRALHTAHSLAVTRFDGPRGAAFAASRRLALREVARAGDATRQLVNQLGPMRVERLAGSGHLTLPGGEGLGAFVVVGGSARVGAAGGGEMVAARSGETLALAAAPGNLAVELDSAEVIVCRCQG